MALSPTSRRQVSTKRSEAQRRRRKREKELESARPAHVTRWVRTGMVAPELRRYVLDRAEHVAAMVQDLGGPEEVSAMERAILDGWFQAQVAADVEFARFIRTDDPAPLDAVSRHLNTARSQLSALGLRRRQKSVMGLSEYLEAKKSPHSASSDASAVVLDVEPSE